MIADDHQVLVDGIRSMLEQEVNFAFAGAAGTGNEVLELLGKAQVDILLLDINLPGMDGIEICQMVSKRFPEVGIVALTMHDGEKYISGMLKQGARGYLLKNTGKQELLDAIQTVHRGEQYFCQEVTQVLVGAMTGKKPEKTGLQKLSRREKEVLYFIVEEFTTQEIADKMFVSVNTVESHRRNLMTKLNARNVAGLVKIAITNNLLDES